MILKIEEFLNSPAILGLAQATQDSYRHALVSNFYTFWKPFKFAGPVNHKVVFDAFVENLQEGGAGGTTIQQYLTILKRFLKWNGTPIEYTYRIPSDERKDNAKKRMDRWFDESEIEQCLDYYHTTRNGIITRLLIETGMRVQELADIKIEDVIIKDRTIWIQRSKTKPRPVFYSHKTNTLMIRFFNSVGGCSDFLFPSASQIKTIVTNMLEELGLKNPKDGRGPHTFRHWCATYLFYTGNMRLEDIARLLGDTPDVIERTYIHPTPAMLRGRVDKAMGW